MTMSKLKVFIDNNISVNLDYSVSAAAWAPAEIMVKPHPLSGLLAKGMRCLLDGREGRISKVIRQNGRLVIICEKTEKGVY
jgi:hypothetical protein